MPTSSCIHIGSSIHCPTSCSMRNSGSTQTISASLPETSRQVSSSSSQVTSRFAALKVPSTRSLAEMDDPLPEVAHVDELHLALGRRRREHLAAPRDAMGPVGEAAGRVVRADDQPGADDRVRAAEAFGRARSHRTLSGAVVREVLRRRSSAGRSRAPRAGSPRRGVARGRRTPRGSRRRGSGRRRRRAPRGGAPAGGRSRRCR